MYSCVFTAITHVKSCLPKSADKMLEVAGNCSIFNTACELSKRFLMKLFQPTLRIFALLSLILVSVEKSFGQDPSFAVYIDNPSYVAQNQYEFDVMVKAMGTTTSFQLRTFQAGIFVDPSWVGAGTVTVSNVAGSSQLSSPGYNGAFNWNATDKLINCSVNIGVRTVSASCVSTSVGTAPIKIARLRLTNSVNFACIPPNIKFNYVQNGNPLRLRTSVSWRTGGCTTNYDMYYPNRPYSGQAYFNGELYSASDVDGRSPSSLVANALPCTVPYNVTVFIQGYYAGSGTMTSVLANEGVLNATATQVDTINVELRSTTDPSIVVSSLSGVLSTTGNASFIFPSSVAGNAYWLVVKHRNSIETWSGSPVTMSINGTYDFSNSASKAYGGNEADMGGGVFAMFNGEMMPDGFIDSFDFGIFQDASNNFLSGYEVTDLNGDGFVDSFDFGVYQENNFNFVISATP